MNLLEKFLKQELKIFDEEINRKFLLYNDLLLEWNKKINLISRRSDSIEEHILNSIFFLTKFNLNNVNRLADIGTGGGFPGIPLKILFPEMEITLIDSINKKVNVLNDLIENMKLTKINSVCGRAEVLSKETNYTGKFDTVISKSVSTLDDLYKWGINFLKVGGEYLLCIKGGDIDEELKLLNKIYVRCLDIKVINYSFEPTYKIEEKKLVIIKQTAK